jgi:dynein heavy chain
VVQKLKVKQQTKNCENLLKTISESKKIAVVKKSLSQEKRKEIEERNVIIAKESHEAKEVLADAQPALEDAKRALGSLDKADITEIR